MKRLLSTINTTYRVFKLLGNPEVSQMLERQSQSNAEMKAYIPALGKNHAFFHKHYIVQVVN
ncbi:hypothetical protein A3H80_01270 [Candidatus Roizmanbacteria bacterium RIFCSPLOWO2_02_FULL_37_19]|uniref:Uncharacterized protein n=1 Tax=Candidatus Roizmanbacteria bacterium RIFCSPHIGHO2_02_FULL_37_24 TaxID=1802037 RepID=A0A1F7GVF9_9BACT|nr:MAG: hypothetical protein A2862_00530 [Candidatus Roizmanbacteria bacterium RIFCSPHIGHO2_01_FULL_38_41]OGK22566.1 MAG: hypothetical protein A3C24_05390 [Candidatus Roizmanbacteria bacterium RIFCSPHIGHO2_02_FULL_37_24]OGK32711.1 MAG: hypothetical protein A3E10_00295 [Candidatus Roizmanbacteria bacterium RIFCSPHIGHO2_12_FULL_37_23]OGK54229.1 MAG: hypothetical protein A3H80_01270 [Candidatus Roizmanbacteria bacterium RIFCSPLOWO2_02_FULL_37_19]OGK58840.1 MAG: hypothetical protein A3G65_01965 [Ca